MFLRPSGNRVTESLTVVSAAPPDDEDHRRFSPSSPRGGSCFLELEAALEAMEGGEYYRTGDWFVDFRTGRRLPARDVLPAARRLGWAFRRAGAVPGDVVHLLLAPEDERVFLATLGVWFAGGAISCGDVLYGRRGLQMQVSKCDIIVP